MSDADSIDRGWGAAALDGTPLPGSLWQVNTRGRKVVGMTEAELAASYKTGKLTARSLVWSDGMNEWTPLGDVPQLANLLRGSQPPQSGTRPRLDEITSGTEAYGTSPEITTNTGGLAVYERPLALIEFPELVEPAEPADEPTPAYLTPTATPSAKAKAAVAAALPKVAPRPPETKAAPPSAPAAPAAKSSDLDVTPEPSTVPAKAAMAPTDATPPPPALPPLPSIRATLPGPLFPSPVLASPLAAALSSTAASASARPTTPIPRIKTPIPAPPILSPFEVSSAPAPARSAEAVSVVKPPRPAIEFLPPIMVHEKEDDDGASAILELPLHPTLQEAPFTESTLVLSGRKRARRWISLNAAVALSVGTACLAASLTALIVRSRPVPPPRVVEKIVTVAAAPVATTLPASATVEAAPVPAEAAPEPRPKPSTIAETPRTSAAAEHGAARPDGARIESGSAAPRSKDAARPDPSGLGSDDVKPRREARAGFPTNPGF